jgi:hypothetical protein
MISGIICVFLSQSRNAISGSALFCNNREQDSYLGMLPVTAFKDKFTVMIRNNSMADGKAQACSYSCRLGRKKGVIYLVDN